MATVVEIPCPHCEQNLKVPDTVFGKKVKCKHCELPFVVEDPAKKAPKLAKPAKPVAKPAAKPAKAAAKAPAKPAASPPPPEKEKSPFMDDDDDEGAKKVELIHEEDVPRCPHCAKELDPPDAKICLHCGFNNLTREQMVTVKVDGATTQDWALHLGPAIIAIAITVALIIVNIWFCSNVREWLVGSVMDKEEKDAAGRPMFYIHPAAFMVTIGVISARLALTCSRFAYRKLVVEKAPQERVRKK